MDPHVYSLQNPSKESWTDLEGSAWYNHYIQYAHCTLQFLPIELRTARQQESDHLPFGYVAESVDVELCKLGFTLYIASYMLLFRIAAYYRRKHKERAVEAVKARYEEVS
jgi:hypothetical protein